MQRYLKQIPYIGARHPIAQTDNKTVVGFSAEEAPYSPFIIILSPESVMDDAFRNACPHSPEYAFRIPDDPPLQFQITPVPATTLLL